MFCPKCGEKVRDSAIVCPQCHCSLKEKNDVPSDYKDSGRASGGLIFLSVMFPIVGIILWAVKRKTQPRAAKIYGTVGLLMWILSFVADMMIILIMMNGA